MCERGARVRKETSKSHEKTAKNTKRNMEKNKKTASKRNQISWTCNLFVVQVSSWRFRRSCSIKRPLSNYDYRRLGRPLHKIALRIHPTIRRHSWLIVEDEDVDDINMHREIEAFTILYIYFDSPSADTKSWKNKLDILFRIPLWSALLGSAQLSSVRCVSDVGVRARSILVCARAALYSGRRYRLCDRSTTPPPRCQR